MAKPRYGIPEQHHHTFARNFIAMRKAMGYSQEQMAVKLSEATGLRISRSVISTWEEFRCEPKLWMFELICQALHVSMHDFYKLPIK